MTKIKLVIITFFASILLASCGGGKAVEKPVETKVDKPVEKSVAKPIVAKPAAVERDAEIRKAVEGFAEQYGGGEIVKIDVNENLGANDGSYLVLAHMTYSRANSVKKTRKLVKMYSEDLAANLTGVADVSDVVVFWEVPRFLEGRNAAKFTYKRADSSMVLEDEFIALELQ